MPANADTRVTPATIQAARTRAGRPPGLTPEDIAKATPDEAARIEAVLQTFDALDRILAGLTAKDAVDVFHFDASVWPPSTSVLKNLMARMSGHGANAHVDPRGSLKSPAYQALWNELLARGFIPELRPCPGNSLNCYLYARMPSPR